MTLKPTVFFRRPVGRRQPAADVGQSQRLDGQLACLGESRKVYSFERPLDAWGNSRQGAGSNLLRESGPSFSFIRSSGKRLSFSNMRMLVTGSSGFIGRHVVATLCAGGHWVAGLDKTEDCDRAENTHLVCDLLDGDRLTRLVSEIAPDAVIHLAARTDLEEKKRLDAYAANIEGVRNLVSAIAATPSVRRCIFTSSQLVCRVGYRPRHDNDYCPNTLYGQSKVRTEQIVRETDGGVDEWCIVRPTTVWGPGMNAHYRRFFDLIQKGSYFHVGTQPLHKSYSYVGNIAFQYLQLLAAPKEHIERRTFYLADYRPIELATWANAFQNALGAPRIGRMPRGLARVLARIGDAVNVLGFHNFPLTSFRLNNILTEYCFDLSPTESVCGSLPFSLEEGVRATVEWIRQANGAVGTGTKQISGKGPSIVPK